MTPRKARTQMVDTQIRPADVTDYAVLNAFSSIPKEFYVPKDQAQIAYAEVEIDMGYHRKMMTPRAFAKLVQLADIQNEDDVLVVGAGLGYETAILAEVARLVIAIEENKNFVKLATQNLAEQSVVNAVVKYEKFKAGFAGSAPYDVVIFLGAIDKLPKAYFDQIKEGGRGVAYLNENGVFNATTFERQQNSIVSTFEFTESVPHLIKVEAKDCFNFY